MDINMSYDISLSIDTGGEEMFEVAEFNYTYNVSKMFRLALDEEKGGLYVLDGSLAKDCIGGLEKAINHMEQNPQLYEPLNPPSGWGSYYGALQWLTSILAACKKHPKCTVTVY